ncbi:MAG: DUF2442 domain-containing protein [Clostridia bacterium]|nr:DUF2442 domain-containing protein [Clostridia bacterium]
MRIIDGVCYADDPEPVGVSAVDALEDYKLSIYFSTGETKIFDATPLLDHGVFNTLRDKTTFAGVYCSCGVPTWLNGEINLDPEYLYENSVPISPA